MSDVKRYRVRDLFSPTDLATLNAVYENAECVLASDHDAVIAALKVAVRRTQAAVTEDGDEPITILRQVIDYGRAGGCLHNAAGESSGATAK